MNEAAKIINCKKRRVSMRNIDEYTKEYLNDYSFERYMVKYRRKKVIEILDRYNPKDLVEIGCGIDPIGVYWGNWETYTVFEPSAKFAEIAVNKLTSTNGGRDKGCRYHVINQPFTKESEGVSDADLVLCSGLLHEVEKPRELLKDIRDSVGSSTIIHINVPNSKSLHRIIAVYGNMINDTHEFSDRNISLQQNTVFDMDTLCEMVEACGFEVLEKGQYFLKPFTHDQMELIVENYIIDNSVLDALYEAGKHINGAEIYVNIK